MIKVNNISYQIEGKNILDSITTEFPFGVITCIVGVSGCGKSTFIKMLSQIIQPTIGSIEYSFTGSIYTQSEKPKNIYPRLTTVFQNFKLFPHLSVIGNLKLVTNSNSMPFPDIFIDELLGKFKVIKLKDKKIFSISAGERQRIALIRAIILNPSYLLLDEITSALDIESTNIISEYLANYKTKDKSIILVTHSLNLCKKIADKIIFIDEGKIVEQGNIGIIENPSSNRFKQFIEHS